MELAQIWEALKSRGLLVNNLHQTPDGDWRASLYNTSKTCWEFGHGETLELALVAAIGKFEGSPGMPARVGSSTVMPSANLEDMGL